MYGHRFGLGYFRLAAVSTDGSGELLDIAASSPQTAPPDQLTGPGNALFFSFANVADRLAYVDSGEPARLWVSDLDYLNAQVVFTDTEEYFSVPGYPFPDGEVSLVWSPDDRHLFVYALGANLLVDVAEGTAELWPYVCDSLTTSNKSGKLALLCPSQTDPESKAVVEWGGEIWTTQLNTPIVSEYDPRSLPAWNSDGTRVAYFAQVNSSSDLVLTNADGAVIHTFSGFSPLASNDNPVYLPPLRPLQFAHDGNSLLAYAASPEEEHCPKWVNVFAEDSEPQYVPCWQVIDVESGQLLWGLGEAIPVLFPTEAYGDPRTWSYYLASINADGKVLALASARAGERRIQVIDISSQRLVSSWDYPATEIRIR